MQIHICGVQPPMPIPASSASQADRRTLAIQMIREALRSSPAEVAEKTGLSLDHVLRGLARAVAEFNMVTAGLVDAEQGARIGSAGLAASIRLAGFRVVAARSTPRADCGQGAEMAGLHGRLKAVDQCNTRNGAPNA